MFASLPMYDRPDSRAAHDALWDLIRDGLRNRGVAAPDHLDRTENYAIGWGRADLVLGQICNLPYRAKHAANTTLIGTADYGLPDCPAGHYNSVMVVHKSAADRPFSDYKTCRFAANALGSHSGYGAPQAWAKGHGFLLPSPILTGSHDRSLALVADGQADITAIDAQTWVLQQRDMEQVNDVRVIAVTATSPGMTFITRAGQNPAPYRAAIHDAIANQTPENAQTLGLCGVVALPAGDYDLPMPPLPQSLDR